MDRASIYTRYQPAVTPEAEPDGEKYWFVFSASRMLVDADENIPVLADLEDIDVVPVRTQYLGTFDGRPSFSAEVPRDAVPPEGMDFREIRSLYGVLDEDIYMLAGRAVQLVSWDQTHQYCGRCGHETETLPDERAKKCPNCGFMSFPRLSPATITAVIRDDKILLSRYAAFRGNMRTVIAGFVEPGETLEECVSREIFEEVGVRVKNIRYYGSQPWPFPNSLMIGFTAEYESGEIVVDGKEISEAGWYRADELPDLPPPMSIARDMIDWFANKKRGQDAS